MPFTYSTGFPTANDSLGTTRARFFQNTQSVKDFVDVNHYDFGNTLAGNHKWVWYGRQTGTFPDTTTPSNLSIATFGATDGTRTQLWYQPSNLAPVGSVKAVGSIQLTAGDVTVNTFAVDKVAYQPNLNGGWTFLPGGLLLQYGQFNPATITAISFPIVYSGIPFNIQLTGQTNNGNSQRIFVSDGTLAAAGFTYGGSTGSGLTVVYWMAIGPS